MALQAHFHLPFASKLGRIHDRPLAANMRLARSMAALAIDARAKPAVCLRWIAVVAEQARVGNFAAEVRVVGPVVPGAHRPISAAFGIPTDRQLDKLPL